ncbi:MAG: hypothetical protein Q4E17_06690 [Synergistes sp.]|nr:hypothetical protein [Synergistes sp.]
MFYRDLFASLCFIFFGAALATHMAGFFFGAMMCGGFALTAKKRMWKNPPWAAGFYTKIENWVDEQVEGPKTTFSDDDEEIKPLPPLDNK